MQPNHQRLELLSAIQAHGWMIPLTAAFLSMKTGSLRSVQVSQ
jgi:hypothetical protein